MASPQTDNTDPSSTRTTGPSLLSRLGTLAVTVFATLMFFEHVVFRFLFVPDDVLHNVSINGVIRYVPNSRAIMRHPDGSRSLVTINEDGWNSPKRAYALARRPGTVRIAVIGDSYVHGSFIDADKGFPELIETELNRRGIKAEVYRFGIDGAPLSQYLHMLRSEVARFRPDLVIVQAIHNDFDESYRLLSTRIGSSFMKLATDRNGQVVEIAPNDFRRGTADLLRNFRTFRYLYYETNAYLRFKGLISRVFWGGSEEYREEFISSAVDIRNLAGQEQAIRFYTRHVLAEMKKLAAENGFGLAFAIDGVREAIYAGRDARSYEVGKLNLIMDELTRELDLPLIDLQAAMSEAYRATGKRLEFPFDWHWNEHGNVVVAKAITGLVTSDARAARFLIPAEKRVPKASEVAPRLEPVAPAPPIPGRRARLEPALPPAAPTPAL